LYVTGEESADQIALRAQRLGLVNAAVELLAEVFNVFNRANYGSYTLQESSPRYGLPNASSNLAYAPRTLQLGFRLTFWNTAAIPTCMGRSPFAVVLLRR